MHLLPSRFLLLATFLFALVAAPLSRAQVFISEFLADNQVNTLVDVDGDHSDWLELWNSGSTAVNLNGWYLTDNSGDLRAWQFPVTTPAVNLAAGARLVIFASGKNRKLDATKLHTNFKLSKSAGSYLALVRPDGLTIEHSYPSYPQQVQDVAYGLVAQTQWQTLVEPGANGKAKVPLSAADMPVGWNTAAFNDSSWQAGQTGFGYDTLNGYGALIGPGGDLLATMYTVNSCALVRIVFNVTNPAAIAGLRLSMKYDDGFNCYLNGTSIQTSLSGGNAWNSGAILDRGDGLTATYQIFTPTNAQNSLVAGTNVLAFQLLNNSNGSTPDSDGNQANGSRALLLPFLEGNFITGTGAVTYLASATPGLTNSAARTSVGPGISNTTNQPPRPTGIAGSAPITVTTKVIPTLRPLNATNPVNLRYRINFGSETTVAMRDNGVAPDVVSGDGIFTALIPTTTAGVGQMIRWKVVATDNTSVASNDPPYLDPTDNDQYYGTVTQDNIVTSLTPILHWFVQDIAGSDTDGGTRCSLFYLGKFYDNVFVGLHGQSSAGFPVKKSHDFNFNEDNRFLWQEGQDEQRAMNLITTYADKSRIRDTLAWESWAMTGHLASHWSKVTRVQQNGAFWGIYDMVENGDEDFPARVGLDPNGALYKIYNSLENTSGAEKKTRDADLTTTDLQALIDGVDTAKSISARRQYSYDNVDVPSLVNYLATNIIILNNDFGHKNYYVYRDTNGTREWSVLPWDQDLSLGHTWTNSQGYFNDDIHSQAGLIIASAPGNRLMNLIMNGNSSTIAPEMAQMFLRRVRSLMDRLLISATATNGPLDQRVVQLLDQIDPPGAAYLTDADLDLRKWGYWLDGSSGQVSPNNTFDAATHEQGARRQAMRILNSNPTPPNPASASNAEGLGNTLPAFLPGRRTSLFTTNPTLNGQPIPTSQAAAPTTLTIERVEFNPASGNQDQEYFIIRNSGTTYVDLSGWKITGAVNYTFRGGTVLPPFTSNSAFNATGDVHNGRLHVARSPGQFRLRTVSPKANEFRLTVGGYSGQLSARGETINLVIPGASAGQDVVVATNAYAGAPTAAQNFLRVTELNFIPAAPTSAESAALPAVQASDFEFIELTNTGAAALNLGGCRFDKGVSFTFPAGFTLQGGARCVIVSLISAYNLRFGSAGATVAGQFEGNLSNSGEELQIVDSVGESVLQFEYDPLWFGVPDPANPGELKPLQGYSLVTPSTAPAWNGYDTPTTWSLSGSPGGSPGTNDLVFSDVFAGWANAYFTASEMNNAAISGPSADPDLDGRINFEEFYFGGNPRAFENKPQPVSSVVSVNGTSYLAITFDRRRNALDASVAVQVSGDLSAWSAATEIVGTASDLGSGMERVTYRDTQPLGNGQRFLRVRATR